jgi:hypothetical protein
VCICGGKVLEEVFRFGNVKEKESREVMEPDEGMHIFIEWSGHFLWLGSPAMSCKDHSSTVLNKTRNGLLGSADEDQLKYMPGYDSMIYPDGN